MLIEGKNLFPLEKVTKSLPGYYMDAAGVVYSTRKGKLTQLKGLTVPSSGGVDYLYYTLHKVNWNAKELYANAKAHPDFLAETLEIVYTNALNIIEGLKKKGWVIATADDFTIRVYGRTASLNLNSSPPTEADVCLR